MASPASISQLQLQEQAKLLQEQEVLEQHRPTRVEYPQHELNC